MKILVTGAKGFVGKNLCATFNEIKLGHDRREDHIICSNNEFEILECDRDTSIEQLDKYCQECDFVFNLAGVNRPKDDKEFVEGNYGFASDLLNLLKKHHNTCPVMLASSIQATLEGRYQGSEYGKSKKMGEELFFNYAKETGAKVFVYRFPNLFGKWCRPNYNSVVATFCYNIANDLPIQVNDRSVPLDFIYIDDVVEAMIQLVRGNVQQDEQQYCMVTPVYQTTLGEVADYIVEFGKIRGTLEIPKLDNPFVKDLYSTYLSYLPKEKHSYDLKMNIDNRGSFTELIRTNDRGQFSVNISEPGITKGNHWHHSKNEKFIVVQGEGLIQMRKVGTQENGEKYPIEEFYVSGDKIQVVEMIPGYTHNIINLSQTEKLVTVMWANEEFDVNKPDTYFDEV